MDILLPEQAVLLPCDLQYYIHWDHKTKSVVKRLEDYPRLSCSGLISCIHQPHFPATARGSSTIGDIEVAYYFGGECYEWKACRDCYLAWGRQLIEDAKEKDKVKLREAGLCGFEWAYGKTTLCMLNSPCSEHTQLNCGICQKTIATRMCPCSGHSFVCGKPLCDGCKCNCCGLTGGS